MIVEQHSECLWDSTVGLYCGPTKVLIQDQWPLGFPDILTVALSAPLHAANSHKFGPMSSSSEPSPGAAKKSELDQTSEPRRSETTCVLEDGGTRHAWHPYYLGIPCGLAYCSTDQYYGPIFQIYPYYQIPQWTLNRPQMTLAIV